MGESLEPVTLWIDPPASKKNRRQTRRRRNGSAFSVPSEEAEADEKAIHLQALAAVRSAAPLWPARDVGLDITYYPRRRKLRVTIYPLDPPPKRNNGRKRDLHGMLETIADALEDAVYHDDRQVAEVRMVRDLSEE